MCRRLAASKLMPNGSDDLEEGKAGKQSEAGAAAEGDEDQVFDIVAE